MGYSGDQKVGTQRPYRPNESLGGGPIIEQAPPTPKPKHGRWSLPSTLGKGGRLERVGFLIIVAAAFALLLLFAGRALPSLIDGAIMGFYTALFVGMLTLSNLRRPARWANNVLGRSVFPVISAADGQIWKLAVVNSTVVFTFVLLFRFLAAFLTSFFAGIVVLVGLVAMAIFYNRARVIIKAP